MPGIDFAAARAAIALAEVLDLLGFVACESRGDQVRGPCPVHGSTSPSSRSFSANLKRQVYRCFKCGSCGNQLDLYAAATGLSLFEATVVLGERLHRDVSWIVDGRTPRPRTVHHRAASSRSRHTPGQRSGSSPRGG